MNVRNLIKLVRCNLTQSHDRAYDNPYEHRLEIFYGPEEMPFHDAATFTDDELNDLICNMEKLCREVRGILNEKSNI